MTDAWFRASERIASSLVSSVSNSPPLASKQLEYRIVSSVPMNSATFFSSTLCTSRVPQIKRTELMPKAYLSRAALAEVTRSALFDRPR